MCQTDRLNFYICLDLVTHKSWAPIQVFGAKNYWLLICLVLQNCDVEWLVKFEEHGWIKFDLFVISDELKHKGFVPDWVT